MSKRRGKGGRRTGKGPAKGSTKGPAKGPARGPKGRSGARGKRGGMAGGRGRRDGELLPKVPLGGRAEHPPARGRDVAAEPDPTADRAGPGADPGGGTPGSGGGDARHGTPRPGADRDKPSPEHMRTLFADAGVDDLSDLQINLFWQYYLRLKARNQEINLTRIHRFEDVVIKHFVDCLLPGRLTELPSPLMDLGSGGGFPGVPLKILHPEVEILLAEGRRLRVAFLEEVRRSLRLPKLHIHGARIHPDLCEPRVAGVITRAVERIEATLPRVEGCVAPGGRVLLMKGPSVDPEIAVAAETLADRWRLVEDHAYRLPTTDHERRLVVYERVGPKGGGGCG